MRSLVAPVVVGLVTLVAGCAAPLRRTASDAEARVLAEVRAFLDAGGSADRRVEPDDRTVLFNEGTFTRLHVAAVAGHKPVAELLLARGADVNARSAPDGLTPLYYAAAGGHLDLARLLIAHGAEIGRAGAFKETPLHAAAAEGHEAVICFLIERGVRPDALDPFWSTPLADAVAEDRGGAVLALLAYGANAAFLKLAERSPYGLAAWAAENGKRRIALAAIEAGANPRRTDDAGRSLLHQVTDRDWSRAARLLIARGADLNATSDRGTPLHVAVREGHLRAVKVLVGAGADANLRHGQKNRAPLHLAVAQGRIDLARVLLAAGADVEAADAEGDRPLHLAVFRKRIDLAGLLIARGANPDAGDKVGRTPLHIAARCGHIGLARLLIERGANVDARDHSKRTVLHEAVCRGEPDLVKLLVQKKANVNAAESRGRTALYMAVYDGREDLAKLLVACGADVNAADTDGWSPLHVAIARGYIDLGKFLIARGANVRATNERGLTPLHVAAKHCTSPAQQEMVKLLLAKGAKVDAPNGRDETPLHAAASAGNVPAAKALVAAGADVNAKTRAGLTPLDFAWCEDLRKLLIARGAKRSGGQVPAPQALSAGTGPGPRSTFFGRGGNAFHIVYLVDRSRSVDPVFRQMLTDMRIPIGRLRKPNDFFLVFLGDGPPTGLSGADGLVPPTPEHRRRATADLARAKPAGPTRLVPGLEKAFKVLSMADPKRPGRLIYLLSDGKFRDRAEALAALRRLQSTAKIPVHVNTYLYGDQSPVVAKIMRQIAKASGGRCTRVEPAGDD